MKSLAAPAANLKGLRYSYGTHPAVMEAVAEIERLRVFVQLVRDCSNDPGLVQEAKRLGAKV
jgi:hypothetical protein